ncbi:type II secretion system pseudopilin PulG [Geotalea daltonii FRC-32]|uniref:Type II secretion system pseudopilin PulG n=1 Tax=Geotalea daltonii (strain DSM 22248 / JCM 15807 / FRC-32) TaxID=316067 RepID=B9M0Z6_GEODF|nr:type II secretion system protein [Geotalea daltonii]ACM20999.1 type II secretion system pseudopilin PulG [Geotalea daltonii FRC-32]
MKTIRNNSGVSLVELVVTLVILSILAAIILPSAQMTARRTKELELKRNLRVIRTAIDDFRKKYDDAVKENKIPSVQNKSGYPETLQQLVEGYDFGGLVNYKMKFLRRIPRDPFNPTKPGEDVKEEDLWGLRSYADKPDSTSWGGEDVYDVYSLSEETAIDGTKYKDW